MNRGYVNLVGVTKRYGDFTAVNEIDLSVPRGSFCSLLGPSGCGKTTSLRMIAGFVYPTSGSVLIADHDVTDEPPERRNVGFVFQNYAIFPHMTIFENIAFGLRLRKRPKAQIREEVRSALKQVGLDGYEDRYRRELSGGQQQRIALARVLVTKPKVLLLDEPLSALDKNLREEMKLWIRHLQQNLEITTIYVTHDQTEALTMSDQVAVMRDGRIHQIGAPEEIYENPADLYVAKFIGESNIVKGRVTNIYSDVVEVVALGTRLVLRRGDLGDNTSEVSIVIRPEHIELSSKKDVTCDASAVSGTILESVYEGSRLRYTIGVHGQEGILLANGPSGVSEKAFSVGDAVFARLDRDNLILIPDASDTAVSVT